MSEPSKQPSLSPEELEQWKEFARSYYAAQQKLLKKRTHLNELMKQTESQLRAVCVVDRESPAAHFLQTQKRLLALSLAQMEVYPLESKVYTPPTGVNSPAYKSRMIEMQLTGLQLEVIPLRRLAAIARDDMEAASAGEPAKRPYPAPWMAYREILADNPKLQEHWTKLLGEFDVFRDAAAQLSQAYDDLPTDAMPTERLAQLKELKVPTLNGLSYRTSVALKAIDGGEALLKELRTHLIEEVLGKTASPAGRGSKQITDRLKDLFKPG